jgi:GGDEF domain-containing protein
LILGGCTRDGAVAIVERLRNATPEGVSCSAGIAEWDRHDQAEVLVDRADSALYEAKRAGGNRTATSRRSGTGPG